MYINKKTYLPGLQVLVVDQDSLIYREFQHQNVNLILYQQEFEVQKDKNEQLQDTIYLLRSQKKQGL